MSGDGTKRGRTKRERSKGERTIGDGTMDLLRAGCRREWVQTRFYRLLAGEAEDRADIVAAERLNGLLADEQHHLSRLTARLFELGGAPAEREGPEPAVSWERWEAEAGARELDEITWYERALRTESLDEATRGLLEEILASERMHRAELGGKWMSA